MNLLRRIDKSPTIKDWPVRIWALQEIKPAYLPYLKPWLSQGLALEHLTLRAGTSLRERDAGIYAGHPGGGSPLSLPQCRRSH